MKKLNRKIFLSACVATFVASSAMAIEPSNPRPGVIDDFQLTHLGNGEYQFVSSKNPQGEIFHITTDIGDNDIGEGAVLETPIKHLTINTPNATIEVGGERGSHYGSIGGIKPHYSFAIKAKEVNFIGKKNPDNIVIANPDPGFGFPGVPGLGAQGGNKVDDGFGAMFDPDTGINSGALTDRNPWGPTWIQDSRENVSLNVFHDGLIDGNVNMDHANFKIIAGDFNGINYNGALTINGDLFAHDSLFTLHGPHQFTVNGNAVIRNSVFELANFSNPVTEKGVYLMSATNFNKEFAEVNTVRNVLLIPEGKLLGLKGHALAEYEGEVVKVIVDQDKKYFNYRLNVIGNDAYAQGGLTNNIKNISISKLLKEMRIEVLTQLHDYYAQKAFEQNQNNPGIDPKEVNYDKILSDIKKEMDNISNNKKVITYGHKIDSVLASLKNSDRHLAANSALVNAIKGDVRQAQAIVDSARESANNSNRQGAIQVINLANEMAIATRMAQSRSTGENSVWANAFGGANIIGSESEGVYGTTIGIDRQFSDAIFFGAYLTYADSQLNHNSLNQDSNNLQLGLYSRITNGQHEFDIKSYAQFSFADQERFVNGSVQKSDFTQTYLGASGNYGYVFDFSDSFSIKPLIGLNLYYSHTPDYTENGLWAQKVYSMDSFAASAEIGAEFRKFFDGGSYFYVTPKIEQFFAMSGDDFKGRFTGSDFSYNVAGAEKDKTFGKILIGSNISVTDRFSIDLSVGAKQILGNKDDNTDETYLTGNIGVKYSF
ncbi:autotransporter outer membrane beta-barrel domain-containing protein [Campylobacter lari]|uniref:autotransporter outer membrane beta-barrel domain-containing protein n=1 Tax=Campylobacter lari TaxID=201 RepID=UPI00105A6EB8|nr:autotransporter outer membrane beta-barrel domain-containing protein [Campylobacter lari]EAI4441491.1 autotransporter outer membrane beta-barrel domain-containing protein [Campylobacter lari]TDJ90955.1 autotransporter outer membrane beta-barrel domain-containing protein [Campylobacter lari]